MRNYCGVFSSNVLDYQSILEKTFVAFLTAQGTSEKTRDNYRSDLRHFIGWTMLTVVSSRLPRPQTHIEFIQIITPELLSNYKLYLQQNGIPVATINRRLSTIRMFFRCCATYGWTDKNPSASLGNIIAPKPKDSLREILAHWKADLEKEGASKSTIKNYLADVQKFLEWIPTEQSI